MSLRPAMTLTPSNAAAPLPMSSVTPASLGRSVASLTTVRPDPGHRIVDVRFAVDGKLLALPQALRDCHEGCAQDVPAEAAIATVRAFSMQKPGRHELSVTAVQDDQQRAVAHSRPQWASARERLIRPGPFVRGRGCLAWRG
jgi:hypothetical protein